MQLTKSSTTVSLKEAALLLRGVLFYGRRYQCPVCGWNARAFAGEGSILRSSDTGYCPRCNAKARHRRIWRFIEQNTGLLRSPARLLEIAPWYSFGRRFRHITTLEYIGIDLVAAGPQVTTRGDMASLPLQSDSVDAALCIHVLEHVHDDRGAIAELYRVLKPGGNAIVSVPIRLDQPTLEDPSVTDPEERKRLFGERSHVRFYGRDFVERLTQAGFSVTMDAADDIAEQDVRKYGLRRDENIFMCVKPQNIVSARQETA
ncbi:MAG: methyltransferase domain-containing protein [Gammaproteobacteria bacterium]|nr:methyltransferase domain-containing protein [Gammaproteobacteria bacterium]